jgi:hypothetical protein
MVGLVAAVMLVTSSIMNLYCHAFAATTIYGNKLFQSQQQQFIIVSSISSTRSNEIAIDNKNQNRNNINNLILNPMLAEDVIAAATMDTNDVAVSVGTTSTSTTTATISSSRDDDDDDSLFSSYLIPNPGGNTFSSMRLWQGRALAILAAAIFGTNFSLVKFLDSAGSDIPIAAAAVLRFTLASIVVSTVVEISDNKNRNNNNMYHHLDWGMTNSHDLEKRHAFLSGGEVGLWYGAGYIAQAVGLHTVDASKVRASKVEYCQNDRDMDVSRGYALLKFWNVYSSEVSRVCFCCHAKSRHFLLPWPSCLFRFWMHPFEVGR